jgi:hypothetical protein
MGVKLGLSHKANNIDRGCFRTGWCGKCMDLRGRKWQEAGGDCIMRGVVTCTLHQRNIVWVIKWSMGGRYTTHRRDEKYSQNVG